MKKLMFWIFSIFAGGYFRKRIGVPPPSMACMISSKEGFIVNDSEKKKLFALTGVIIIASFILVVLGANFILNGGLVYFIDLKAVAETVKDVYVG
jgi:hypothetical protein